MTVFNIMKDKLWTCINCHKAHFDRMLKQKKRTFLLYTSLKNFLNQRIENSMKRHFKLCQRHTQAVQKDPDFLHTRL